MAKVAFDTKIFDERPWITPILKPVCMMIWPATANNYKSLGIIRNNETALGEYIP